MTKPAVTDTETAPIEAAPVIGLDEFQRQQRLGESRTAADRFNAAFTVVLLHGVTAEPGGCRHVSLGCGWACDATLDDVEY